MRGWCARREFVTDLCDGGAVGSDDDDVVVVLLEETGLAAASG